MAGYEKFQQGLLGVMQDPMFQMGMGLLARPRQNFGRAFGGAARDMSLSQMALQQARDQALQTQQQNAQKQREQEWIQQNMPGMAGAPGWMQQAAGKAQFSQPKVNPKMVMGPGGKPIWANAPDAIGQQAYSKPLVSVNTGKEQLPTREQIMREDSLASAKADREWNAGVVKQGSAARGTLPSLKRAENLLNNVNTGTLESSKLEAKKLANALGFEFDPSGIANAEELQVYLGDQLMNRVAQTKGAVSNKEMELFERLSGSFGKTTEGNRAILKFQIAKSERDIKLAKLSRDLRKQGKTSEEIRYALEDYIDTNDLSGLLSIPDASGQSGPGQQVQPGKIKFLGFE